jgi:hypothetical protein
MQQILSQLLQFLQQGISAIFRFVQLVWEWSVSQVTQLTQVPWQEWPILKQALLVIVLAGVIWAFYKAAKDLWEAGGRVLGAFAALLSVLVKTLPNVVVAGLIAVAGVWLLNNLDLGALRLPSVLLSTSR